MTDKVKRITELRRNLQKKAVPFHGVFNTPDGQEVLNILKAEFDPPALCQGTAHATVVAAAQRDVIEYIEIMMKLREETYE